MFRLMNDLHRRSPNMWFSRLEAPCRRPFMPRKQNRSPDYIPCERLKQNLQKTWISLLRFVLPLVSQRQNLFANALCEGLELLHRVANARSRRLVAVPVELLEVARHRSDELLQLCIATGRGRGL